MRYLRPLSSILPVLFACLLSSGCIVGPQALRSSRTKYNEAIKATTDEQLLLNLVRLKYRDSPLFLAVGNVSAQFVFDRSGEIVGTINEGPTEFGPDVLRLQGKAGYSEKPTITFTPLQGKDFVERVLAPLTVEQLLLLSRSGWSLSRVFRIAVQRMNGLDNATTASGPTPESAPAFADFARISQLFRELQEQGRLDFRQESNPIELSDPIPASGVDGADVVQAAQAGYRFKLTDDGKAYVLTGSEKVWVLRIAKKPAGVQKADGLQGFFAPDPDRHWDRYEVALGGEKQSASAKSPNSSPTLTLETRSVMGVLSYLSQGIEIPQRHQDAGLVTMTRDADEQIFDWSDVTGDLMKIQSQRSKPRHAAVSIRYRGYWFYIDQADLNSKSTFVLLGQLLALQAGGGTSVAPVLTLPVGG